MCQTICFYHNFLLTYELLELQFHIPIKAGVTLLFLDEIQAVPQGLSSLRYFYENMPESVAVYLKSNSWQQCDSVKHSMLLTYQMIPANTKAEFSTNDFCFCSRSFLCLQVKNSNFSSSLIMNTRHILQYYG